MLPKEIKVPHPKHGYVIFTNATARQREVLEEYLAMKDTEKMVDDMLLEHKIDSAELKNIFFDKSNLL